MRDYAAVIQGLLANAEDEALTDAARQSYRDKAEELMVKYRIEEENALATEGASIAPVLADIRITTGHTTMTYHYQQVWSTIARHCGIRFKYDWSDGYVAKVVGYQGDVRYAEFLWTAALLMFSTRIDPRWDATLPEAENIWRMRNAGIKRKTIADKAWGNGYEAAARSRVQRVYLAECKRRGEIAGATGLSHDQDTYREAYASGFHDTLSRRLRDARNAADSIGGGLVLHDRMGRVDEAFYAAYPDMRPREATVTVPTEPCERCAKAKSGHCRDHKPWLPTKADYRRWDRQENSPSAHAGRASGKVAADGVVITRGHTQANRLDASGRAIEG